MANRKSEGLYSCKRCKQRKPIAMFRPIKTCRTTPCSPRALFSLNCKECEAEISAGKEERYQARLLLMQEVAERKRAKVLSGEKEAERKKDKRSEKEKRFEERIRAAKEAGVSYGVYMSSYYRKNAPCGQLGG